MKNIKQIYIVDDEPLLTRMLTDYLNEKDPDLNITSFPTGEECLKKIDANPDFIILDYHLNSREQNASNGIDILKTIREQNKTLPVVILSSQESYSTAAHTIQHGAIHYVIKGEDAFNEIYSLIQANT